MRLVEIGPLDYIRVAIGKLNFSRKIFFLSIYYEHNKFENLESVKKNILYTCAWKRIQSSTPSNKNVFPLLVMVAVSYIFFLSDFLNS